MWQARNAAAANTERIQFLPLTDNLAAMTNVPDASISIGALSVQPGGTGVILAGTGDPNDALDSYYGAGILRSTDGGVTWKLIQYTTGQIYGFLGEGFAGFAWSTDSPQLVVAAVSQAWEGVMVGGQRSHGSYEGLYYSADSGATWFLAQIADPNGQVVQGPQDAFVSPDGNAATSVVWNPVRKVFIAAVRYHGYYQSTDGAHWTRLSAQPGSRLTTAMCPNRLGFTGSTACPIYRGTLAVNPRTGDTFAWTVDLDDQDQGIWQDVCAVGASGCANQAITFGTRWNTDSLQTDTWLGSATIQNGTYNLALAAVPSDQDTILLAGGNDLWKCSLAMGCTWRNTTNATSCRSAKVGEYQHALEWNASDPLELFMGNDSGLWRSTDGIAEAGPVCAASDVDHFQNLNGALGSLAEVEGMSDVGATPYTMVLGLGANGTAGVKSTTSPVSDWPQVLSGEGGPVAIDPANPQNWYVNNGAGVSIHLCSQVDPCTSTDFGSTPVVSNADVNGDGLTMFWPAPFLVDPLDSSQLLVATCRIWRGPANGTGWTAANAISPMFDGNRTSSYCNGNALVRSVAAMPIGEGGEVVYAGTYGSRAGGATLPGHVLSATLNANGVWSAWQDLTFNPVVNDYQAMNPFGMDISSLYIDPHDPTGKTIYVTIEGIPNAVQEIRMLYRSNDGGAHWYCIDSTLTFSAANSLVIDPQDENIAYVATDAGVYVTLNVTSCASSLGCWSRFGAGLPNAPVVALSAAPPTTSPNVLVAGTFGRGVWQIPLASAGTQLTTASVAPGSLDFGTQGFGATSSPQTLTLTNTGGIALLPATITASGDFSETDNCAGNIVNGGASCTIRVTFRPSQAGSRSGQLSVSANIPGATLSVALSGTGDTPGVVTLTPVTIDFGQVKVGSNSAPLSITAENSGGTAVVINSLTVSGPFVLASNSCGTSSLAANSDCQLEVEFAPTASGKASGALTMVDAAGTQSVQLTGIGAAPPTDTLSVASLTFPQTIIGAKSDPQTITLKNDGDLLLTSIAASVSGPFELKNDCKAQLGPHSPCVLTVWFLPTQVGTQTGALTVRDDINSGQTVSLSGTGIAAPALSVTPTALTFPPQPVGVASSPSRISVKNIGGAGLMNLDLKISETDQPSPSFSIASNTCGPSLAGGVGCEVQVVFTPRSSGGAVATLTVSSSNASSVSANLSGTGQSAAGLNVNPPQLSFAPQELNQPSAAQTVTVSNSGDTSALGLTLAVSGPFSLSENHCGTSLAAGASCTTSVVFTPQSRGTLTGTLTIAAANETTLATVSLSGTGGLTGAVQITPALVNFPLTGVASTSSPVRVTIANGGSAVELDKLQLSASAGFKVGNNTCGESLKPGASCTVDVSFAPTAMGAQNGTFTMTSQNLAASVTIPLSGTGFDFQAAVSGSSSQTVSSGQTATYLLSLVNPTASSASFTLQCGSLPAYTGCEFNPSSTTIGGNTTGSVTLQLSTSQTSSSAIRPTRIGGWQALPPVLAIVLLPLVLRSRRRTLISVLALIFIISAGLTACSSSGGGGGGTPPPSTSHTTQAGSYTIPVTVSSTGVQHTVSVTLVVD